MLRKGDLSEKKNLIKLARESAAEEKNMSDFMDMKYGEALLKFLDNNPGKTEDDYWMDLIYDCAKAKRLF